MDIVTVVFREELDILKLQAQSIELYCQQLEIGNITVIINDSTVAVNEIDPAWWGQLGDRVKVLARDTWPVTYSDNGWLTQQALKLVASTVSHSAYSMILDAKTLFVQPVSRDRVFDHTGILRLGQMDIYPVFEPSQRITEKLFDIQFSKQLGPGGVPFVVHNDLVRYMIQWIENKTQQNFLTWFQDQGMLTEFVLYSGWLVRVMGSLDLMSNPVNSFGVICNVCHSEVEQFDNKFLQMQTATTVSIHRRAWAQLNDQQRTNYRIFLQNRGITRAEDLL